MKKLLMMGTAAIAGLAVVREVRKPADQRTWEGEMFGFLPYDFRPPTMDRMRERMWNPKEGHIITPMVFGLGWTLNFGALAKRFGFAHA